MAVEDTEFNVWKDNTENLLFDIPSGIRQMLLPFDLLY